MSLFQELISTDSPEKSYEQAAIKVSVSVFFAVILNHYLSFSHEGWLVLTTFLVSMETKSQRARHGLLLMIVMMFGLVCAENFLTYAAKWQLLIWLLLFISAAIFLLNQTLSKQLSASMVLFALVIALVVWWPHSNASLRDRIIDVVMGGGIGIICSLLIYPFRASHAFRFGIIPTLKCLHEYSIDLSPEKKINLENSLINPPYPEWIYEIGFNPGLRSGFRFFLVHLEQMIDLYLILPHHFYVKKSELPDEFNLVMENNAKLIALLQVYFTMNRLGTTDFDFSNDLRDLEAYIKTQIPSGVEMLELSHVYTEMTALLQTIKDIRQQLLQLLTAITGTRS